MFFLKLHPGSNLSFNIGLISETGYYSKVKLTEYHIFLRKGIYNSMCFLCVELCYDNKLPERGVILDLLYKLCKRV